MSNLCTDEIAKYSRRIEKLGKLGDQPGVATSILGYQIMRDYYRRLLDAAQGPAPIAWYHGQVLQDFLYGAGVLPMDVEWLRYHLVKNTPRYIEVAESHGFEGDTCTATRVEIGIGLAEAESLPKPRLVIAQTANCDSCQSAAVYTSHHFNVPIFVLDTPYALDARNLAYFTGEIKKLIEFLEKTLNIEYDWDILKQIADRRQRAEKLLREIYQLRQAVPSPMRGRDALRLLGIYLRTTMDERGIEWLRLTRDELAKRVQEGKGAVKNERRRVLWCQSHPLFVDVTKILEDEFDTAVVFTENEDWLRMPGLDPNNLLESAARRMITYAYHGFGVNRVRRIIDLAKEYKADGCIHFSPWGCKVTSNTARLVQHGLEKEVGIPTLILQGDYMDERNYSEAFYREQFLSFIDML